MPKIIFRPNPKPLPFNPPTPPAVDSVILAVSPLPAYDEDEITVMFIQLPDFRSYAMEIWDTEQNHEVIRIYEDDMIEHQEFSSYAHKAFREGLHYEAKYLDEGENVLRVFPAEIVLHE